MELSDKLLQQNYPRKHNCPILEVDGKTCHLLGRLCPYQEKEYCNDYATFIVVHDSEHSDLSLRKR